MERSEHVLAKLERAREHLDGLQAEAEEFFANNPYLTSVEDLASGGACVRLHVTGEPPVRWGAIVGDVIHNLRSSLDVLVYQLVESNWMFPTKNTAFPVCETASEYARRADRALAGLSSSARQAIDDLKPFREGNPELYLLHSLDIEDKHHLLLPVGATSQQMLLTGPPLGPRPDGSYLQMGHLLSPEFSDHLPFPLEDGMVLLRTDETSDEARALLQHAHRFFFYVAMQGPSFERPENAIVLLQRLGHATEEVCAGLLPLLTSA